MGDKIHETVTQTTTASYVELLRIRVPTQVNLVGIQLIEKGGQYGAKYKISGRNSLSGADEGEDFDLPKNEGEDSEATEFTLAASANVREVIQEEAWMWLVVWIKDASEAGHASVKGFAVGG